jgi:hypothetical protein
LLPLTLSRTDRPHRLLKNCHTSQLSKIASVYAILLREHSLTFAAADQLTHISARLPPGACSHSHAPRTPLLTRRHTNRLSISSPLSFQYLPIIHNTSITIQSNPHLTNKHSHHTTPHLTIRTKLSAPTPHRRHLALLRSPTRSNLHPLTTSLSHIHRYTIERLPKPT